MVSKVSDITAQEIANYLRIDEPTQDDLNFMSTSIQVAKSFILKYTGIEEETTLDDYPDMVAVVYVLCQDMYDNRSLYVDNSNVNRVVDTILGLYQRNLL